MSETYLRVASIFPFFIPAVRDYIDVLNNVYASVSSDINLQQVLQQSFLFILSSLKFSVFYFLSFQWIQDLTYLPVVIPQLKIEIIKENFFLQTPQSTFFTFLEIPSYINNKFLLGFFNSFFLCLPLSVAHIISTRRLLIQGLYAGISSSLGTILGQIILLICIIFGGRFFIIPWFNFQAFNYFLGICLALNIVYDMAHERSIRIIEASDTFILLKIFLLNFALAWTEQSCIFQYFGNLTFGAEPTLIEIFSSPSELQSILTHLTYIMGMIMGSLVFTTIFIFNCLKINDFIVYNISILYTRWIRRLNFSLLTLIIAFTFTSIPFYSFDYLVLSNLGFVSQDKVFKNSVFFPTKTYDFSSPILGDQHNYYVDKKPGIDTDITPFDKGRYLMFDVNDSFEQLNYHGEYAWLTQKQRIARISRSPNSSAFFRALSKFFQKSTKSSKPQNPISSSEKQNSLQLKTESSFINTSDETSNSDDDLDNNNEENLLFSSNRLHSRIENERKINEFFEHLVNMSISNKFFRDQKIKQPMLEKKFKQKYYSNPIYKLLLSTDIDFFLSRQPREFALNPKQEAELFNKRLILANYYDSLRYYTSLPYAEEFEDTFNGSKSYADRIYNQQFKGTLKIVRRLFSINLTKNDNKLISPQNAATKASVVKQPGREFHDQGVASPLNNETPFGAASLLKSDFDKKNSVFSNPTGLLRDQNVENLVLKFDQPLYKKSRSHTNDRVHSTFHEELRMNKISEFKQKLESEKFRSPFIQLANPIPFYVGWDEQLRKLVITNRLSPKSIAGYSMKFPNKNSSTEYGTLQKQIQKSKTIDFTTWPVPKNFIKHDLEKSDLNISPDDTPFSVAEEKQDKKRKLESNQLPISYNFLFESIVGSKNKSVKDEFSYINIDDADDFHGIIKTIPVNIAKNYGKMDKAMEDIIPYTRGGFVWPGHNNLQFKFKKLK